MSIWVVFTNRLLHSPVDSCRVKSIGSTIYGGIMSDNVESTEYGGPYHPSVEFDPAFVFAHAGDPEKQAQYQEDLEALGEAAKDDEKVEVTTDNPDVAGAGLKSDDENSALFNM